MNSLHLGVVLAVLLIGACAVLFYRRGRAERRRQARVFARITELNARLGTHFATSLRGCPEDLAFGWLPDANAMLVDPTSAQMALITGDGSIQVRPLTDIFSVGRGWSEKMNQTVTFNHRLWVSFDEGRISYFGFPLGSMAALNVKETQLRSHLERARERARGQATIGESVGSTA